MENWVLDSLGIPFQTFAYSAN